MDDFACLAAWASVPMESLSAGAREAIFTAGAKHRAAAPKPPTRIGQCMAPRSRPHPHRNRPRDKLKNRSQGPARGFCYTLAPGEEPERSSTGTGRRKRKAARNNSKP